MVGWKVKTISTKAQSHVMISFFGLLIKVVIHWRLQPLLGFGVEFLFHQWLGQTSEATRVQEALRLTRAVGKEVMDNSNRVKMFHRVYQYLFLKAYHRVLFYKVHRFLRVRVSSWLTG